MCLLFQLPGFYGYGLIKEIGQINQARIGSTTDSEADTRPVTKQTAELQSRAETTQEALAASESVIAEQQSKAVEAQVRIDEASRAQAEARAANKLFSGVLLVKI